ncbi:MAG: hypothetical protein JWQ86_2829 [Mycobacterium sp.]|nr:hypothetical protein [Mycobacterium sp.]
MVAVNSGRAEIAHAISPQKRAVAQAADTTVASKALVATSTTTQPALVKAKPKGPVRKIVAAVRKEIKTVVKGSRPRSAVRPRRRKRQRSSSRSRSFTS